MATLNKRMHQKINVVVDNQLPFDSSECQRLIAYGYKKNPNCGIFTTIYPVDEILLIVCEHRSDDELITIKYKNGEQEFHDGSDCRIMNFDCYTSIYTTQEEIDGFIEGHLYNK